jgi:MEMO1 family protein
MNIKMKTLRIILLTLMAGLVLTTSCRSEKLSPDARIREPAVAGRFYPAAATQLKAAIDIFMKEAVPPQSESPVAIIVPHAGYIFSGQISADGFNQVKGNSYDTVVILGTNHTTANFSKVSVYSGDGFRTPLGIAEIDKKMASALLAESSDCIADDSLHESEHSVEVQVPFVQTLFPAAKIVPVVVGTADVEMCRRFGLALAKVLKGRRALIVASTDLSHYPNAEDADSVDRKTLLSMISLDTEKFRQTIISEMKRGIPHLATCACGEAPAMVAMTAARALGATGGLVVSYLNSGDVPIGEKSRVVGYGAVVLTTGLPKASFVKPQHISSSADTILTPADKKALLSLARESISRFLKTQTVPIPRGYSSSLQQKRGVFVTLKEHGQLRGCIGNIASNMPLAKLVSFMAWNAAFADNRFRPVRREEIDNLEIEISVLTPPTLVKGASEIAVGRDGVVIEKNNRSAVFLPQVATEQGWNRDVMLSQLCRKADLPEGCWKKGAKFYTFQASVFSEAEFKNSR